MSERDRVGGVGGALEVPFKRLYDIKVCTELISVGLKVCL